MCERTNPSRRLGRGILLLLIALAIGCGDSNSNVTVTIPDISTIPEGDAQCAAGGLLVRIGPDTNENGTLDDDEVTQSTPVCNGVQGEPGSETPVEELADGLIVSGCWHERQPPMDEVEVETYDDHRIAMSLAVVGLRREGVIVRDPAVVAKSYPNFWRDLATLLG